MNFRDFLKQGDEAPTQEVETPETPETPEVPETPAEETPAEVPETKED